MPTKIDSHQHFWVRREPFDHSWQEGPGLEPLRRDFLPADLQPRLAEVGIERTVFVQTQHDLAENDFALNLASDNPWIAGVVGWVDLASEECEQQLLEYKDRPKFVGVRHVTHDEPDDDFVVREDVVRGLKVLERHAVPFDLLFYVRHLKHAATLGRRLPDLAMVIDHLGKPEIQEGKWEPWLSDFKEAAKYPNIYCKLSGMITEADWEDWKPSHLRPYVETALEHFGPERCMFGSDWPVCILAGSYAQVYNALDECLDSLSESEKAEVLGGTAAKFYNLS